MDASGVSAVSGRFPGGARQISQHLVAPLGDPIRLVFGGEHCIQPNGTFGGVSAARLAEWMTAAAAVSQCPAGSGDSSRIALDDAERIAAVFGANPPQPLSACVRAAARAPVRTSCQRCRETLSWWATAEIMSIQFTARRLPDSGCSCVNFVLGQSGSWSALDALGRSLQGSWESGSTSSRFVRNGSTDESHAAVRRAPLMRIIYQAGPCSWPRRGILTLRRTMKLLQALSNLFPRWFA